MKTRTKSFVLVISLLFTAAANAQVTIGSDAKPSPVALLDIKTQDNATGGVTSTRGGVLLPRVTLQEINSLKPFIASGGTAIDFTANKGLVVYNLTTTSPFVEGFYIWNGSKWITYDYSDGIGGIGAVNGLTLNAKNIELGGTLTKPTMVTGSAANTLTLNAPTTVLNNDLTVTARAYVGGFVHASGGLIWRGSPGNILGSTLNYGALYWNQLSPGYGEVEFIDASGTGGGGFRFFRYGGTGTVKFADWIYYLGADGSATANSDRRIKTEIEDIKLGLSDIMKLRPVKYNIHPDRKYENGKFVLGEKSYPQIGFIAQEVEDVIPDAVAKPKKEEEIWGLSYERLIPVLTKALQEQQAQIEKLEQRIEELEKNEK